MSRLALGIALSLGALLIATLEPCKDHWSSPPLDKGGLGGVADSSRKPEVSDHAPSRQPPTRTSDAPLKGVDAAPRQWQPIFNGVNLDGWEHIGGGHASVKDGILVLEHDAERRPGYLVSQVSACDFEARFQCRIETGDSGFFFRCRQHSRTPTEMAGPQVQLNVDAERGTGGIFELHGRGWVRRPSAELNPEILTPFNWLDCHIFARGDRIVVTVNGRTTVDFLDAGSDNDYRGPGVFALQIHGGGYCRALFREMSVRLLE